MDVTNLKDKMKTTIVNLKNSKYDVYIGRGSIYGNPFRMYKESQRTEVIEKYEKYFIDRIINDEHFASAIYELKGKVLGCYCKPLVCHGDIIVAYLEGTHE